MAADENPRTPESPPTPDPGTVPAADVGPQTAPPVPAAEADSGLDQQAIVTVVPGVPRFHNASCILIRFMGEDDLDKMTVAAARDAGCTPCRACLPA